MALFAGASPKLVTSLDMARPPRRAEPAFSVDQPAQPLAEELDAQDQ
jgi:hypothetical protein